MAHYYVKSHFSGWRKVSEEQYNAFVNNFMNHATGMNEQKKTEYIKTITRIEEESK